MKSYVSDRMLFLLFGIVMMMGVPYLFGPTSSIWIDIIIIVTWGGLCWRIIILPIDLCIGTVTKIFKILNPLSNVDSLVLSNTHSFLWRVIDTETGEVISLIVPESIIFEQKGGYGKTLPENKKMRFTYYRLAKITIKVECL